MATAVFLNRCTRWKVRGEHITKVAFLIRARSVVQVHPGPPFKSPINTRLFSLFPFPGTSSTKPICQSFVNLSGNRTPLHPNRSGSLCRLSLSPKEKVIADTKTQNGLGLCVGY